MILRHLPLRLLLAGGAAALWLSYPGAIRAQTSAVTAAHLAATELNKAMKALDQARGARDRIDALTRVIRAHEDGLSSLRDSLRQVDLREQGLETQLGADRARISRLLGVMAGMERTSGPLMMLHPAGPLGTARAGSLLSAITPALQAEADQLAAQLANIKALRAVQLGATKTLAEGLRSVQAARVTLSQAVSDRRDLPRRLTETPETLTALVQSSETLDAFAALLMDTRLPPEPGAQTFSEAKGTLPLPVQGRIARGFNGASASGPSHPGLTIATRPKALVTLPWAATLRYAGPLLDYANVMVAEPEDGYLLIMTGLGEMFGEVGQVLPAGAPIGLMGGNEPESENLGPTDQQAGGVAFTESLYIELRYENTPTDPAPWFEQTGNRTTR